MDEETPMHVQIRCFIILRRIEFVIFMSWKRLQLPDPRWLWKNVHIWSLSFTPLKVEWRCCMSPCSNPFPCVLKRVSGSNKFIRSARPYEHISNLNARVSLSFGQVHDSLTQAESKAQMLREHVQYTLVNAGPHPQGSEWAAENTSQLEKDYKHN